MFFVGTFGGEFGVQFAVTPRAGTGLENLNDSSSRWTLPILETITVKF
jgi:hypothetical protein